MKETLEERLARIGAEAEEAEADQSERPIPPHVKVSRPNRARSKVLQVRLNPDEFVAIERIAARRELPTSTVAREQLLRLIAAENDTPADRLMRLFDAVAYVNALAQELRPEAVR